MSARSDSLAAGLPALASAAAIFAGSSIAGASAWRAVVEGSGMSLNGPAGVIGALSLALGAFVTGRMWTKTLDVRLAPAGAILAAAAIVFVLPSLGGVALSVAAALLHGLAGGLTVAAGVYLASRFEDNRPVALGLALAAASLSFRFAAGEGQAYVLAACAGIVALFGPGAATAGAQRPAMLAHSPVGPAPIAFHRQAPPATTMGVAVIGFAVAFWMGIQAQAGAFSSDFMNEFGQILLAIGLGVACRVAGEFVALRTAALVVAGAMLLIVVGSGGGVIGVASASLSSVAGDFGQR